MVALWLSSSIEHWRWIGVAAAGARQSLLFLLLLDTPKHAQNVQEFDLYSIL